MLYHKTGKHTGRVVECDGDIVYLRQANGVELDFPTHELTATAPAASNPAAALSRTLTLKDIAHHKVLAIIPQRTLQSVATVFERQPGAGRFSALNVAQKLNVIAEITAVPYRTMKEFSDNPGTLGLMMGRELALRLAAGKKN